MTLKVQITVDELVVTVESEWVSGNMKDALIDLFNRALVGATANERT